MKTDIHIKKYSNGACGIFLDDKLLAGIDHAECKSIYTMHNVDTDALVSTILKLENNNSIKPQA
jgi:hypothetical protein